MTLGNFQEGGSSAASVLRQVEVEIVDRETCFFAYLGLNTVTQQMVCAGVPGGGKDACQVRHLAFISAVQQFSVYFSTINIFLQSYYNKDFTNFQSGK